MASQKATLIIDSSNSEQLVVSLRCGDKTYISRHISRLKKSQVLLGLIDKLLRKHGVSLSDITDITVNQGPGSFTGLRVGVAIANTLGWALDIPVNGYLLGNRQVEPIYS